MLELMAIIAIVVNSALIGMSGQVHRWFPNYSGAQIFLIIVILEVSHTPPQIYQVLLRPPSGHHPGRRQSRHARILQIGLRLAIAQTDAPDEITFILSQLPIAAAVAALKPTKFILSIC